MKMISLALASLLFAAASITATAADAESLLPARVTHAITERIAHGEYPTMVVAVVDDGRSQVYGFGKLGNGKTPDGDTVFQIGSVTKTFTATLLAEAVGRGEVALDTPVAKLLAGFTIPSRDGKPITLGALAEQVSGLPRMPGNLQPRSARDPYADYGVAKLKAFLADYSLTRDPGSEYEYSNLGFGLLGHALAKNAGTTYADLVQARILQPLGMTSSAATFTNPLGPHWATGHDQTGKPTPPWHLDVLAGAGAINSTGTDMMRYLKASMGRTNGPLQPAMHLAQQPRRKVAGDERIGLAWMTLHDKDGDVIWHNGMTGGYASFMGFTADGKRGVVILTNIAQSVDDLGFATLLADAPLAPSTKPMTMSPQQLDDYVGRYQLAPGFILSVFRDGDQLNTRATGQGVLPVYPGAADKFFARAANIRIDFQRGKDGKVTSLVVHQDGHDTPAPRLDTAATGNPARHHPANLTAATLQQYVGVYQLAPGARFTITLTHGQLHAQLTGQSALPIYPSTKDEFYYTVVDAQLSFKRNAAGKVDALVLHQNGRDQRARRTP